MHCKFSRGEQEAHPSPVHVGRQRQGSRDLVENIRSFFPCALVPYPTPIPTYSHLPLRTEKRRWFYMHPRPWLLFYLCTCLGEYIKILSKTKAIERKIQQTINQQFGNITASKRQKHQKRNQHHRKNPIHKQAENKKLPKSSSTTWA